MKNKNILIIGAGIAGQELLTELNKHKKTWIVKGFIDDDPEKQNKKINNIPILGKTDQLSSIVKKYKIQEIFIAIPSARGETIRSVISQCQRNNVKFKIVPRTLDIVEGKVNLQTVREVKVEDILGRAIVQSDQKVFYKNFEGKKILVTGAAGSIGSELCRQLINFNPKMLVGIDWWESGLFEVEMELKNLTKKKNFNMYIGNIQNAKEIETIFQKERPDFVFHAAAYKHVPLMQIFPDQAVKNNIFGTLNIAKLAYKHNVKKFINISTDKAVNPTSIMGTTKLIGEYIVKTYNEKKKTKYASVRFGNVLGSHGSVLPIFKKQIAKGGPITVTDRNMTRFFMTIPEAVQLILNAAVISKGGEVFILDMGEPVKIMDLARTMIKLSGFEPNKDIKIKITGRRPGEKLHEKLFTENEDVIKTENKKIFIFEHNNYQSEKLSKLLRKLKIYSKTQNNNMIYKTLKTISPDLQQI